MPELPKDTREEGSPVSEPQAIDWAEAAEQLKRGDDRHVERVEQADAHYKDTWDALQQAREERAAAGTQEPEPADHLKKLGRHIVTTITGRKPRHDDSAHDVQARFHSQMLSDAGMGQANSRGDLYRHRDKASASVNENLEEYTAAAKRMAQADGVEIKEE